MNFYFYALIRHIPDLERCEPRNVGLIIHSPEDKKCIFRLNHNYPLELGRWQEFFESEINSDYIDKDWFLSMLEHNISNVPGVSAITLSRPMILGINLDIDEIFEEKFERLVL